MPDIRSKKGQNNIVVRAKFTGDSSCVECINDMMLVAEKYGIDIEQENDGSFQVEFRQFHYHSRHGCPHEGPYKGKKLLKSMYVE